MRDASRCARAGRLAAILVTATIVLTQKPIRGDMRAPLLARSGPRQRILAGDRATL